MCTDLKTSRFKIVIAYDGTEYAGWQVQPNGISIQEMVEKALFQILQTPIRIHGSGRTDSGVHASGQVAHFDCQKEITPPLLMTSLNRILPGSIRILSLEKVPSTFHARFSAQGKKYTYHITHGHPRDPFNRFYSTHVPRSLDVSSMKLGAKKLIGTHDFTSFANIGNPTKDRIRTIYSIEFMEQNNQLAITFHGNGFLYKMVRNLVGLLLEIGKGKIDANEVTSILEAKDRKKAPLAAPPTGLFLSSVDY